MRFAIIAAIGAAVAGFLPVAHARKPPADTGLNAVNQWIGRHILPYRITTTYETGALDTVNRQPPEQALALCSFDLPVTHTAWPALTQYRRAMLYDTALGVIYLSLTGQHAKAHGLLLTMEHLQNRDGSIGFGWNTEGDGFLNSGYVRTGANAWAGYAAVIYERTSGSKRFQPFAEKVADFVLSRQVDGRKRPDDPRRGLVTGGRGLWAADYSRFDANAEAEWACTEHAVDSYFLLRDLGRISGSDRYTRAAQALKGAMLRALWCQEEGRFFAAIAPDGQPDRDHPLDASSWGGIFLAAIGEKDKARRALEYVERTYRSTACGVKGYKPYARQYANHPVEDWDPIQVVWSEGSLGVAYAYWRLGDVARSLEIERQVVAGMQLADGGVRYSIYGDDLALPDAAVARMAGHKPTDPLADFVRCPTAAGTIWLGLVQWSRARKSDTFWGPD